ncbi:hypothetical protein [Actinoplanes sp. TFC3]|nr:hypothetical protein [Actinoplanes sp. TFC3]
MTTKPTAAFAGASWTDRGAENVHDTLRCRAPAPVGADLPQADGTTSA